MRPGTLLISKPFLGDPNFERSVVLLCRDEPADGSFGLVINQLTNMVLDDVLDLPPHAGAAATLPLYVGGPVEPNTLHYLHRRADLPGATDLGQEVYWGGDFDLLLGLLGSGAVPPADVRLFAGYSGWSAGQLAGEMQGQSWIRHPASAGKVFTLASDAFLARHSPGKRWALQGAGQLSGGPELELRRPSGRCFVSLHPFLRAPLASGMRLAFTKIYGC